MGNQEVTGRSVPDGLGSADAPEPFGLGPSGAIPSAETYCLALIAEECGEAVQLIGKALRFGIDTPGKLGAPFNGQTARTNLAIELGDIRAAITFAAAHGLVDEAAVRTAEYAKIAKLMNPEARDNLGRQLAPQPISYDL